MNGFSKSLHDAGEISDRHMQVLIVQSRVTVAKDHVAVINYAEVMRVAVLLIVDQLWDT